MLGEKEEFRKMDCVMWLSDFKSIAEGENYNGNPECTIKNWSSQLDDFCSSICLLSMCPLPGIRLNMQKNQEDKIFC